MEILDIPEKLQLAILHPDKSLTVDLRVRFPALVLLVCTYKQMCCD
jgi:hypothetical protein